MPICKNCGKKYIYLSLGSSDYCEDCQPELSFSNEEIEDIKKENNIKSKKVDKNSKEEIEDNITCGIVSCVLGILSLFTGAIGVIFAIISLVCGISNSKNAFGIIGIIVSSIYLFLFLLGALGLISILAMN
ncbi:hypothetical protein [Aliarcobacter butzleri]|uniref:hypothetical protein n=1 Tax=Aliarcobacter butzleri TaxID=28197 RepID=UPI001260A8C1|nr:hypothetical protein [Aliarcobacter butzleri]